MLSKEAYTPGDAQGKIDYQYNAQPTYLAGGYQDVNGLNINPLVPYFVSGGQPQNCQQATQNGNLAANTNFPYWLSTINDKVDIRATFVKCCESDPTAFCSQFSWPTDYLDSTSPVSGIPAAFTTEALYYAQSGYFVTIVMVQWSNVFACKSRKVPLRLFR